MTILNAAMSIARRVAVRTAAIRMLPMCGCCYHRRHRLHAKARGGERKQCQGDSEGPVAKEAHKGGREVEENEDEADLQWQAKEVGQG
jgi:hypothetical protein